MISQENYVNLHNFPIFLPSPITHTRKMFVNIALEINKVDDNYYSEINFKYNIHCRHFSFKMPCS